MSRQCLTCSARAFPRPRAVSRGNNRDLRAFTLLELLTVLAIVAVLASLLSVALKRTEGKAHHISCLNNLRQLQVGWILYVDENDDHLPLNKSTPGLLNEKAYGRRNTTNSWVAGNPKEDTNSKNLEIGSLFPYTRFQALYRCPQDDSRVITAPKIRRVRSYSMSSYMNGDGEGLDPRVASRFQDLHNPPPAQVFVFIEEHESSGWIGSFAVVPRDGFLPTPDQWISTPSDRHGQGCNLSFADGHVEYWKWFTPKQNPTPPRGGVNSQEPWDLKRLQKAIPNLVR